MPEPDEDTEITRLAEALAASLTREDVSFDTARQHVQQEYVALLNAVRNTHERFAFDREGRPGAIHAVREALPLMERDLFEAVLDDHVCEVAAVEEALYQLARAVARAPR